MRFRDEVIASYIDDEWRTPGDVHRLLGDRGTVADIAYALERLARAGKIEAKHEAMMVPKFRDKAGPPVLSIDFYRKLSIISIVFRLEFARLKGFEVIRRPAARCPMGLVFRPGNSLTKSREFLENGVSSSGPDEGL